MAYAGELYWVALVSLIVVTYVVLKAVYRLFFHPLARFPGPRLGALTSLWAASYDLSAESSLIKILPRLHEQYGPVVRVRPNELHVFDWDAYTQVFRAGTKFNRDAAFYSNPIIDGSILSTADGEVAKPHKNLYSSAFSKSAIAHLESLIHEKLGIFLARLDSSAFKQSITELDTGFNCLTGDIVMYYCYQRTFGFLDSPDFNAQIIKDLRDIGTLAPVFWYFPNFGKMLGLTIDSLPDAIRRRFFPAAAALAGIQGQCRDRLASLRLMPVSATEVQTSIFKTALHPNVEKGQYVATEHELVGDAVLMFLAGTDTTAVTLTMATYHVLTNPEILASLLSELDNAMPNVEQIYSQSQLENLPYLRAIIKESLRFSHGASARLMRITPGTGTIMLGGKQIPAGTPVSFSNYVYNNDSKVFPEPHVFRPERWLAKDISELESRMISFSRGSRSCLGINLAYAELYVIFAHLFRRYKLSVVSTSPHDMDWKDCFTPRTHGHLRVRVARRRN